jgi:transcriptional regulator with XRE-family HTH domain
VATDNPVRALRKALGMSQEELAKRSGGEITQSYLARIEAGRNKASSWKVRSGLAKAFGLSESDLNDYLDGRITVEDAAHRTRPQPLDLLDEVRAARPRDPSKERFDPSLLEVYLVEALDAKRHTLKDTDAVRAALRNLRGMPVEGDMAARMARRWLDIASDLRVDSHSEDLSLENLFVYLTLDMETRIENLKIQLEAVDTAPVEIGFWDDLENMFCEYSPEEKAIILSKLGGRTRDQVRKALWRLPHKMADDIGKTSVRRQLEVWDPDAPAPKRPAPPPLPASPSAPAPAPAPVAPAPKLVEAPKTLAVAKPAVAKPVAAVLAAADQRLREEKAAAEFASKNNESIPAGPELRAAIEGFLGVRSLAQIAAALDESPEVVDAVTSGDRVHGRVLLRLYPKLKTLPDALGLPF